MRRTRRHKIVNIAIFFLAYFIFIAYSEKLENKNNITIKSNEEHSLLKTKSNSTNNTKLLSPASTTVATKEILSPDDDDEVHATLRPKRNCTPPAIEQVHLLFFTKQHCNNFHRSVQFIVSKVVNGAMG